MRAEAFQAKLIQAKHISLKH